MDEKKNHEELQQEIDRLENTNTEIEDLSQDDLESIAGGLEEADKFSAGTCDSGWCCTS